MKQILSKILFSGTFLLCLTISALAQLPTVTPEPMPGTCQGVNTYLHYTATNSPNTYSILWYGSPTGLPDVPAGTFLPPGSIPITVLLSCVPGTYYGQLTVSNVSGGSSPEGISLTVFALPGQYPMTGGGGYCVDGAGVDIGLAYSQAGVLYQLYLGGSAFGSAYWGTGAALDFGLKRVTGTYRCIATNNYSGCTDSMPDSATVVVNPTPTAFNVTGGGGYCSNSVGVPIVLSNSNFGTYYQLYRDTTAIGSPLAGIGISLDFGIQTAGGTYTILGIDSAGPCTNPMAGFSNVYVYPAPTVYDVTGGGSFCYGGYGVRIGLTGSNTDVMYKLYLGHTVAETLTGTGLALDFGLQTVEGTYTVRAINSVYACEDTMTDTAFVNYIPDTTPSVSISGPLAICHGMIDTFRAVPLYGGSAPSYEWDVNGTFSAYGDTYVYTPVNGDNVVLTMTSSVSCARLNPVTTFALITVAPDVIPNLVMVENPGTTIVNGTTVTLTVTIISGGVNPVIQWLVNGVIVAGANTRQFSTNAFVDGDSVTCLVYGCADTPGSVSTIIHVTPRTGITQINAGDIQIQAVPNPSKGIFTLTGDVTSDNGVALKITDMLGNVVYTDNLEVSSGKINARIQLPSGVPAGMYLLSLHSESANLVSKILVE